MTNMITVAPGFQYSINIGYDLWNDDKLSRFIPTKSAFKLLEEILLSTNPSSSDRARVLIGAYGKGKSHIVLMILSILMKNMTSQLTRRLKECIPPLLQAACSTLFWVLMLLSFMKVSRKA